MSQNVQQHAPLVLIADDDAETRLALRRIAESAGCRVAEASNGAQALAAYKLLHPDLVLLDVVMPEVDGFAACASIRALRETRRAPVWMVTALGDSSSIALAFEIGADDYILKPPNEDALRRHLHALLKTMNKDEELDAS